MTGRASSCHHKPSWLSVCVADDYHCSEVSVKLVLKIGCYSNVPVNEGSHIEIPRKYHCTIIVVCMNYVLSVIFFSFANVLMSSPLC